MKKKLIPIVIIIFAIAFIGCSVVFFSHHSEKIDDVFSETVRALDSDSGLEDLFLNDAFENRKTMNRDIKKLYRFYEGKSVEVKDYTVYRESATVYRAYATIVTDRDSYFVSVAASGARMVDTAGIKQIIVEKSKTFDRKKIFKRKLFDEYVKHAEEYGITIRVPGDR